MKKHKDNIFAEKFRLLNSQESAEIIWSSSESSDFECETDIAKHCNLLNKTRKRKRKAKVPKNISNLDITIIDVDRDHKDIVSKDNIHSDVNTNAMSPILGSSQHIPAPASQKLYTSPIILSKSFSQKSKVEKLLTSPILVLKTASPKVSPKVRKSLFKTDPTNNVSTAQKDVKQTHNTHKLINNPWNRRHVSDGLAQKEPDHPILINNKCQSMILDSTFIVNYDNGIKNEIITEIKEEVNKDNCMIQETPEVDNFDDSMAKLKTPSSDVVMKVKSFFDSHFSSETTSQNSISDVLSSKNSSKISEDIEINNSITQAHSNRNSPESIKQEVCIEPKIAKKVHYKKDGLAYRLNALIKKQTASISLWQHERFLAANSNFVIPKGEFLVFRIRNTLFSYGNYLLDVMDVHDGNFIILIHNKYVTSDRVLDGAILKLYEPYKIVDFVDNCKLIINVCKFECAIEKKLL